jgi:hypothetical protein
VYVDGFNLYYGCLKGTPHEWLDLSKLCGILHKGNAINRIRYYPARVRARPGDPNQQQRQQAYIRALETIHQAAHAFTKQALPMVWDFAEVNPLAGAAGDFTVTLQGIAGVIGRFPQIHPITTTSAMLISRTSSTCGCARRLARSTLRFSAPC